MKYQSESPIQTHHDTLYTKDSLGNIRIWHIEQNGDRYRTHSGLKDSDNIVISEWTVALPKNEGKTNSTSGEEQATAEILAKYKKQRKTGYYDHEHEVDGTQYVEPMLAKLYRDYREKIDLSKGDWGIQCKFNGMRCVAIKSGLFTRKGEKYISVPHIEESLRPFFVKYPNAVLDGELFNNELRQQLNEISKLIRKTVHITDEDLANSKKLVKYYIYDGYNDNVNLGENESYSRRKEWIDCNVIGQYDYTSEVKTKIVKNQKELDNAYQELIDDNQEGGILRYMKMKYEHKRSKNLLKIKPELDSEALIIDIKEGTGNWSGTGKVITLQWNGKVFDSTFKGTHEQAVEFLKKKNQYIGKIVTFLYNGETGLGVPNYARIDINNCFKENR
jgi:DNA ligase-1